MTAPVTILAAGSFAAPATEPTLDIKTLLREAGGPRLRRSNRLTELALLGALRCCQSIGPLHEQSALYLASGQGNVGDTVSLLQQIVRDGLEPMPFSFINVSSNMAGFAVAQALGLQGRNMAVSRNGGAFDSALELALLDLLSGSVPMALVGVVEECAWPLPEHRRRLGVADDMPLAEQSSWLLLSAQCASSGVGMIAGHQRLAEGEALPSRPEARWFCAPQLPAAHAERLAGTTGREPGYSESITVHHLIGALEDGSSSPLCYLNGDGAGGAVLFEFLPAR